MEEILCKATGNSYTLAFGYGVTESLQGAIIEAMPDDAVKDYQKKLSAEAEAAKERGEVIDVTMSTQDLINDMSGSDVKKFLIGNNEQSARTIARCIRKFNGKRVGNNYEERVDFCMDYLDHKDGKVLAKLIAQVVQDMKDADDSKGESDASWKEAVERSPVSI